MSECVDASLIRRLLRTKVTTFLAYDPWQQSPAIRPAVEPRGASPPRGTPQVASPASAASLDADSIGTARLDTVTPITDPSASYSGLRQPEVALSWIITKKLSLRIRQLSQQDVDLGYGLPMIIGKFLCHLEGDPTREAFLRMYSQIPITGTEDADLATLTKQIRPRKVPGECEAYRRMMSRDCRSVPRFYGYSQNKQGEDGYVPGGLIEYLAWEKVPGEPLTEDLFWSLDSRAREDVRVRFRAAYEEIMQCEVEPDTASISKITYNQSTGDVRISGFRGAWPVYDELNWSDTLYVFYGLAKPHDDRDWPSHPEKWEY